MVFSHDTQLMIFSVSLYSGVIIQEADDCG